MDRSSRSRKKTPEGSGGGGDHSESSDVSQEMQVILERRRRLADGDEPLTGTPSQHSSSPVKQELKAVPMGSEMQAIMAKRREKADNTTTTSGSSSTAAAAAGSNLDTMLKPKRRTKKRPDDERSVDSADSSERKLGRRRREGGTRRPRRDHSHDGSKEDHRQQLHNRRPKGSSSRSLSSDDKSVRSKDSKEGSKDSKRKDEKRRGGPRRGTTTRPIDATSDHGSSTTSSSKPHTSSKPAKAKAVEEPSEEPEESLHLDDDLPTKSEAEGGGWGGFPAFGGVTAAAAPAPAVADAFGGASAFGDTPAFGGFDDLSATAKPAATTTATTKTSVQSTSTSKSLTKSDFDDAFSPAAFESGNAFAAFGSASVANFDVDFGTDHFASNLEAVQEAPPEKVWDKTPLKNVPRPPTPTLPVLGQEFVLTTEFEGRPTNNPVNGNILAGTTASDGTFWLRELDPRRGNVQVAATPVLSTEFKRKVTTKYNATCHKVESILSLTAGLHYTNGQRRTRVAAILDLSVLESRQILRLVAVWQWGYATAPTAISLQYTITPPSGGDFHFDSSTLQIADGLLFLAGASPKGPCVFMCKPAVKETWSANFLGGSGRVACMSVAPLPRTPYLAIAMTEGNLNVWTYQSALQPSKEASKRWLFPLCRLEVQAALTSVEASSLSENSGEATGRGELKSD